jgi:hypothetical protein
MFPEIADTPGNANTPAIRDTGRDPAGPSAEALSPV